MSTLQSLPSVSTEDLRAMLAGLVDPQAQKPEFYEVQAKLLAVNFCASLPSVYGSTLDRMKMWEKIGSALQSGYAKTAGGDVDLFVNHVLDSIQADMGRVVASAKLEEALNDLQLLPQNDRQDWLQWLISHLAPVLLEARRQYKSEMESLKEGAK